MPNQEFVEVSVVLPYQFVDAVSDFISENISAGLVFEEINNNTVIKFYVPENVNDNYAEKLNYYFKSLMELHDDFNHLPEMKERIVENVEWEEAYKESVKAVLIAEDISVRPPWDEKPSEAVYDIVIEPKRAFGTGSHETTRSCLEIIRHTFKPNMTFLDMGCGSGILSILADQLKAKSIKAIDYDEISVENTIENFTLNNVTTPYETGHGSIELCEHDTPYDFVCANMIKKAILSMLDKLCLLIKPGGILLLSGLLEEDVEEVEEILFRCNMHEFEIIEDNEWRSILVRKSSE